MPPPPPPGYPQQGYTPPPGFPPPPPGYGTAAGRGGAATLSAGDAIAYAVGALKRYPGPLLLIAVVVACVQGLIQLGQDYVAGSFFGQTLFALLGIVVSWALSLGLVQAALAVVDGRRPEVSMLYSSPKLGGYLLGSLLAGLALVAGLILLVIPGLIVLFLFQLWGYAFVDRPGSDPVVAIRTSINVVKANVGSVLVLDLLIFLAWFAVFVALSLFTVIVPILGFLAIVAAGILVYPTTSVALAYAWRRLTGGPVAPVS